jgi:WD40 repeat protein
MAHGMATSLNPPTYPENGTYADLLVWHLYVWRTRPDGSTTQRGEQPWGTEAFKEELFRGATADDEEIQRRNKNFNNWTGEGQKVAAFGFYHDRIVDVVFGNAPKFEIWIKDLKASFKRSSPKGNNILSLKVEVAIAALASAGYIPAVVDRSSVRKADDSHIASAAEQDTVVIIERLAEYFVGRSSDIEAIDAFVKARMEGGPHGLMVITAPPGIGKTTLAAHWCKYAGQAENRRIVRHFCSMSTGTTQTKPEVIFEHLHKQIADVHGKTIGPSGHFNALTHLLCKAPPDGQELVVWLDGIDEANGAVDCFVPYATGIDETIGDRVCVIVSARAEPEITPAYLDPWLEGSRAKTHNRNRHELGKLSKDDIEELITKLFTVHKLTAPEGLALRILKASDDGWPLFVRNMIDSSIGALRDGRVIDLGDSPESLLGYAKVEIERLANLIDWRDLHPIFVFLTIAKQAVSRTDLEIILGKKIFPETFPSQLRRWLNVVEDRGGRNNHMLSFAHPLLAKVFGQQLGDRKDDAEKEFAKAILPLSYSEWPQYASRHLPRHLLDIGLVDDSVHYLTDIEFITARFAALGTDDCLSAMKTDWMAWYGIEQRAKQKAHNCYHDPLRHLRFWNNYSEQLFRAAAEGFDKCWLQMMHDVGLADTSPTSMLVTPKPEALSKSLATLSGHEKSVNGALILPDDGGYLSWSNDGTLRLWSLAGEAGLVLRDHDGAVKGAVLLPNNAGFISWSEDGTLRLWSLEGEAGLMLREHERAIAGAVLLPEETGFLSWNSDHTLRLWNAAGEPGKLMRGHETSINGALILPNDAGFLSWSDDGTLRLWDVAGEPYRELRGHTEQINGALVLPDGTGFLSWSNDDTLRLWGAKGERGEVLRGHLMWVSGALVLPESVGFLSWSYDDTLRLWGMNGKAIKVLRGHRAPVVEALILPDGAGFLSWSHDKTLRLWEPTGKQGPTSHECGEFIDEVLLMPDRAGFISWSRKGVIRIWDWNCQLRNIWLSPSGGIDKVSLCDERNHYRVVFSGHNCIVHLPFSC